MELQKKPLHDGHDQALVQSLTSTTCLNSPIFFSHPNPKPLQSTNCSDQASLHHPLTIMLFLPKPPQANSCPHPHHRPLYQEQPHHPTSHQSHTLRGHVLCPPIIRPNAQATRFSMEHPYQSLCQKWYFYGGGFCI